MVNVAGKLIMEVADVMSLGILVIDADSTAAEAAEHSLA
jgi:hypothetical protein